MPPRPRRSDLECRWNSCIPDPRRPVIGGRDDARAVGRVGGGFDIITMAGEHRELRPRERIPDAGGLVIGSGDDAGAVGRIGGGIDVSPWPESTASCAPVRASQMRAVLSTDAVTMRVPSGE